MEIILCSGRLNFSQTSNRKLNHDLHIVHNCLHGGAPKANGPRISVDSFIIIIRPFHLLLPPLRLVQTHSYTRTCVKTRTYTRTHTHDLLSSTFFSSSFPAPFELHRFSNISRSRHHYGHQSRERLVRL